MNKKSNLIISIILFFSVTVIFADEVTFENPNLSMIDDTTATWTSLFEPISDEEDSLVRFCFKKDSVYLSSNYGWFWKCVEWEGGEWENDDDDYVNSITCWTEHEESFMTKENFIEIITFEIWILIITIIFIFFKKIIGWKKGFRL